MTPFLVLVLRRFHYCRDTVTNTTSVRLAGCRLSNVRATRATIHPFGSAATSSSASNDHDDDDDDHVVPTTNKKRRVPTTSKHQHHHHYDTFDGIPRDVLQELFPGRPMDDILSAQLQVPPPVVTADLPHPTATRHLYRVGFLEQQKKMEQGGEGDSDTTTMSHLVGLRPAIEHGVAPPIECLTPIDLSDIATKLNYIHKGRVLFAQVVDEPYRRVTATNLLVQDDTGNCVLAALFNYYLSPHNNNNNNNSEEEEKPADVFPKGMYLAFLEPYMRHFQNDRNAPVYLRCDNPQCIIRFPSEDAWRAAKNMPASAAVTLPRTTTREPPTAWQQRGDDLFSAGKFDLARIAYTEALSDDAIDSDTKIACLCKQTEINLRFQQWEAVERDCREILAIDPGHAKARYRLATALLRLNKIKEGHQFLVQQLGKRDSVVTTNDVKILRREASRWLRQSQGHYDLAAMHTGPLDLSVHHADYVSDAVQIGVTVEHPVIGRYRGCVATSAIAEGVLITASKAFAFVPTIDDNNYGSESQTSRGATPTTLSNEIVRLLHRRPELAKRFYQLSDGGDDDDPSNDEIAVSFHKSASIDLDKIYKIRNANGFAVTATDAELDCDWNCVREARKLGRKLSKKEEMKLSGRSNRNLGSGIWITESFFNHSCNPNCTWSMINDHMFIHSNRPIAENEELTMPYLNLDTSFAEKSEAFAKWAGPGRGFSCACAYCVSLRSDAERLAMEAEVSSAVDKLGSSPGVKIAKSVERVLPERRRRAILSAHASLSPELCHWPIEYVERIQGKVLLERRERLEAYRCFERAAEIQYAIGGATYPYAKAMWRLVGSALDCCLPEVALQHLHRIKSFQCFQHIPKDVVDEAFLDLTLYHSLPYMNDPRHKAELKWLVQECTETN